ncbi:Protein CBG26415 [Caenorhabditis briggsae]|uniref:Protein CBG26415 n=1 Tax=Caenorhabditis briggsae TaxID=6238 RepID=B6ILE8_CAEBR|nr:Protein CBG26415 [Caenorhabditis briggsae]CAS00728.1 Protein CBG26415 [Caenorhabditis briggsae]
MIRLNTITIICPALIPPANEMPLLIPIVFG